MQFVHPQFLWGLLSLAIPLIIHFFNFRKYKTLYFSNTAFLQELQRNTRSFHRLRHWLVLLLRMLLLAALVLAFAQPYRPARQADGASPVSRAILYIDNSPSMQLMGAEGELLQMARQRAIDLLDYLPDHYRYRLVTNDFSAADARFKDRKSLRRRIDELQLSYRYRSGAELYRRIYRKGEQDSATAATPVFLLSDFSQAVFESWPGGSVRRNLYTLALRPVNAVQNLAIDSVWLGQPVLLQNLPQELSLRLRNYGDQEIENLPVHFSINGQVQALAEARVPAGSYTELAFEFFPGEEQHMQAQLSFKDAGYRFDNDFRLYLRANRPKRVLLLMEDEPARRLAPLFRDTVFQVDQARFTQLDYAGAPQYDLLVLHEVPEPSEGLTRMLQAALARGHNLLLIPTRGSWEQCGRLLATLKAGGLKAPRRDSLRGIDIRYDDPHFKNTFLQKVENPDLPVVQQYFPLQMPGSYDLITLENGAPLVARQPSGKGQLLVSAVDLSDSSSNLWRHLVARPLLMNAALYSGQLTKPYLQAGRAPAVQHIALPPNDEEPIRIFRPGEPPLIPPQREVAGGIALRLPPQGLPPGFYPLGRGGDTLSYLAVNGAPEESDPTLLSDSELSSRMGSHPDAQLPAQSKKAIQVLSQSWQQRAFWPWLIALALALALTEMIFLKV